jgi:uncharacterized integral membrane protein
MNWTMALCACGGVTFCLGVVVGILIECYFNHCRKIEELKTELYQLRREKGRVS